MSDNQPISYLPPADHNAPQSESSVESENRRRHERYEAVKPLVVVPVLPDGTLDWDRRSAGFSVNVCQGGLGIEVDQSAAEIPSSLLVGVEDDDGQTHFAGVNIRYHKPGMSRGTYVGAAFGGPGEHVLRDGKLRPQFNAETLSLQYPLPQSMLDSWVEAGVLIRTLCDRVQMCPQCRSLPTFRYGCRKCYSARVKQDQLIHHFACAHVDQAANFQKSGELICPKCRTAHMVVGADFEYLNGQHHCLDCQWQDTTLESIAHCLKCNHRFAADEAHVLDVYTYSANRLTWRQMIDSRRE